MNKDVFAQLNPLYEETLKTHQFLEEKEKSLNLPRALDELKTMINSDETKNELTKEMAKLFIEAFEYNREITTVLSELEKRETIKNLEKIYFENIDKIESGLVSKDDAEELATQVQNHFKIFLRKFPIKRIHRVIALISEIQSADNYSNGLGVSEDIPSHALAPDKDYKLRKPLRRELKTLLQQALDEKGSESEEFKLYQELLSSNQRTKVILDHNNKKSLSNKLKKAQENFESNQEFRRARRKLLVSEIRALSKSTRSTNIDEKDPFFEELEKFNELENYTSNFNNYLKFKNKINNLESRLSSNLDYAFKKSPPLSSPHQLGKDECDLISFDNQLNMGPDSNQKDTGTCWAHASAALIEEQLCLAHPEHCGKRVARTYIIGKTKGINFFNDEMSKGANILPVLSYFIDPNGGNFDVCLDPYSRNPLNLEEFDYAQYLLQEYYLNKIKNNSQTCSTQLNKALENLMGQWEKLLAFLGNNDVPSSQPNPPLSREKFEQLIRESHTPEEFIQKILLSPCAHSNWRVNFKRDPEQHLVSIDFFTPLDIQNFLNTFRDAKSYQHSLLLSMCFNQFKGALGHLERDNIKDECGSHAVIANAVHWDFKNNRCEVHLKNSHGQYASVPSGWYPAETVFKNTRKASYFGLD